MMNQPLPTGAQRLVDSAEGWLGLGDWQSAQDELEQLAPPLRAHPSVLALQVEIHSAAKRWEQVIVVAGALARQLPNHPVGYVRLAYALHELRRTKEAWDTLFPVFDKFPEQWIIPYNLACYAAQLGDTVGARDWLAQAARIAGEKEIRSLALDDPDLASLWAED